MRFNVKIMVINEVVEAIGNIRPYELEQVIYDAAAKYPEARIIVTCWV